MVFTATLTGRGCSLQREALMVPYVTSDKLVKLFERQVDDGGQYYRGRRSNIELSPEGINHYE